MKNISKVNIEIDGKMVAFKASATIPRLYRNMFGRDIFKDISKIQSTMEKQDENESNMQIEDLEMFENMAYAMAYHANASLEKKEEFPATAEEWLDQFSVFSIYEVFPKIMELWNVNNATTVKPKKKANKLIEK